MLDQSDLDETLDALGRGLRRDESMAVPVVITRDGILIDGHQRLRALRAKGRKLSQFPAERPRPSEGLSELEC